MKWEIACLDGPVHEVLVTRVGKTQNHKFQVSGKPDRVARVRNSDDMWRELYRTVRSFNPNACIKLAKLIEK